MNNLISGTHGTPLFVIGKDSYNAWLDNQDERTLAWLKNTKFTGEGATVIPAEDGQIAFALAVVEEPDDHFACGDLPKKLPAGEYQLKTREEYQEAVAYGWASGCYRFNRYKKADTALPVLVVDDADLVEIVTIKTDAIALVRDLVNTPAADMMPVNLADAAVHLTHQFGGKVTQIVGKELLEQNYPTIHAVGRASANLPTLIDLQWGDDTNPRVTLVGKGVCFDSGGLDLKPASGMRLMKKDMGGAAHVLGLAHLIMATELPVNLRVLIPAVENAVSSNALRPGDVITTRSGITVEIDNTDAEGRLVLCDAISEAENDNPELLIDFATLTGAMRIGLGTELPGFFSTNDDVANGIIVGGENTDDPVWRMPLYQPYKSLIKSKVADLVNCAAEPTGGAITAALYLQEFVSEDRDWVHFDIMAWNTRELPGRPVGGEAFGVRAVFDYLEQRFG